MKEFGRLDIVVSNSGIEHFGSLTEVTGADIDAVFAVNVKGQYFVAQQAYKHMADFGRVMLTSSISAVKVSSRVHLGDRVVLGYSEILTPLAGRS